MAKKGKVIQPHHVSYEPEWVEKMYQGEHWVITQLNRRKSVTLGFIQTLKAFIARWEHRAIDLDAIEKEVENGG